MQVMITNGGPHPAEKWGQVTAQAILSDIASNAPQVGIRQGDGFQRELESILTVYYEQIQEEERQAIEHDLWRLGTPIESAFFLAPVVSSIVKATRTYSFGDYFLLENTHKYLCQVIGQHIATAIWIERSWRAEKTDHPAAVKFRQLYNSGV